MARLPRPNGAEMVRFLQQQGFELVRVRSSHHYFARGDQHTTVPVHGSRALKIGTLRSILRDINLSATDFAELWQNR